MALRRPRLPWSNGFYYACALVWALVLVCVGSVSFGTADEGSTSTEGEEALEETAEDSGLASYLAVYVDTGDVTAEDWPLYLALSRTDDDGSTTTLNDRSLDLAGELLELDSAGTYKLSAASPYFIASDGTLVQASVSPSEVELQAGECERVVVTLEAVDPSATEAETYAEAIEVAVTYLASTEGDEVASELEELALLLAPAVADDTEEDASQTDDATEDEGSEDAYATADVQVLGNVTLHFIDVGQGDCTFIELPDGSCMLIDAGTEENGTSVVSYIRSLGYSKVDYVVATHPHADHIGGLVEVLESLEVGEVWAPEVTTSTNIFSVFLDAVEDAGLQIYAAESGDVIASSDEAGYSIQVIGPISGTSSSDLNTYSLIMLLTFGDTTALFTGDASSAQILAVRDEHVDVLKVAHHGSSTGTTASLASALSPVCAVISYGANNSYGHPTQTVLDALEAVGASIYGTAVNGTVVVTMDGTSVTCVTTTVGTVVAGDSDGTEESDEAEASDASNTGSSTESTTAAESEGTSSTSEASATTVYVTEYGEKYHTATCRYIRNATTTVTAMTEEEAVAAGYEACKVCNP